MQYQRRDTHGRKHRSKVGPHVEVQDFPGHGRTRAGALVSRPPIFKAGVTHSAGRKHVKEAPLAPVVLDDVKELLSSLLSDDIASGYRNVRQDQSAHSIGIGGRIHCAQTGIDRAHKRGLL